MSDGKACQRCGEHCVGYMSAKCADGFYMKWPGGREQEGYVPPDDISGVRAGGSEDYMEVNLCLACGQVQGEWPKKSVKKWLSWEDRPTGGDSPKPTPQKSKKPTVEPGGLDGMCRRCKKSPAKAEEDYLCELCQQNKAFCENWSD